MSIAPVSSSSLFQAYNTQSTQIKFQQIQSEFQQLSQDLQAGNLSQAQQDFAALQQNLPGAQVQPSSAVAGRLAQAFQALGQDLQSGNLSAAQQDFATIQQTAQQRAAGGAHGHHHHRHASGAQNQNQSNDAISQAFGDLGQALQAGNLSQAQQAYTTIQQDLVNYLPGALSNPGAAGTPETITATSASSSISVTAKGAAACDH
jgi:hypothetical protein